MKLSFALSLILCLLVVGTDAQTRKTSKTAAKPAASKKNEKQAKDTRKTSPAKTTAKKDVKKDTGKPKAANAKTTAGSKTAKTDPKRDKQTAKTKADAKDTKKKLDPKKAAELKRAEAARRKQAEEKRQAALAEQRRREQAAREARERKLAFERGLRTETVENIERDNTEGEDLQVRRAAVNALGSHAGTVVVMEAKTGKLLTVVNQDWAIKDGFKPCSTIKLVTSVAGVNEDVINGEGGIGDSSAGMKLDYAIAKSNNPYFQRVGSSIGNAKMIDYAKRLGLGEPTGINVEGETSGKLPYGNNNARIYSHGDDFEVTPLQLAVMVSALSNGGKKVVPFVPRSRVERTAFRPRAAENLDIPRPNFERLLPGMVGTAEYGTARRGVDASMGVAGKTGSCIGNGSWVGLFASVAPVEDPKYSVVVITRGQSERGRIAAAIAGRIYETLRPRISRDPETIWAKRTMKAADIQTAKADDEEEDDALAAESDSLAPVVSTRAATAAPQPAVKKLVQKTGQSQPVLKPIIIEYDRTGAEKSGSTRPRVVKN